MVSPCLPTAGHRVRAHRPDWLHGSVDCEAHYGPGGVPITNASKALSSIGYTMLSCMPWDNQILDVMEPYMWAGAP